MRGRSSRWLSVVNETDTELESLAELEELAD